MNKFRRMIIARNVKNENRSSFLVTVPILDSCFGIIVVKLIGKFVF